MKTKSTFANMLNQKGASKKVMKSSPREEAMEASGKAPQDSAEEEAQEALQKPKGKHPMVGKSSYSKMLKAK